MTGKHQNFIHGISTSRAQTCDEPGKRCQSKKRTQFFKLPYYINYHKIPCSNVLKKFTVSIAKYIVAQSGAVDLRSVFFFYFVEQLLSYLSARSFSADAME